MQSLSEPCEIFEQIVSGTPDLWSDGQKDKVTAWDRMTGVYSGSNLAELSP